MNPDDVLAGHDDRDLLSPAEVAVLFGVNVKTVSRWNVEGRLPCIRTLGGHRRFRVAEIRVALAEEKQL